MRNDYATNLEAVDKTAPRNQEPVMDDGLAGNRNMDVSLPAQTTTLGRNITAITT